MPEDNGTPVPGDEEEEDEGSEVPTRDVDPQAWLEGFSKYWARNLIATADIIDGIRRGFETGAFGYPDHLSVALMLEGPINALSSLKEFLAKEANQTAIERAIEIQKDFTIKRQATSAVEEAQTFLDKL